MTRFRARSLAFAALALVLYGCNREQSAAPPAESPPTVAIQPSPAPPAIAAIPPATELPLNSVDSVMLSRPQDEPMAIIIRVSGTAVSPGWTEARLTEDADGEGGTIKSYKFVAVSPEMPDNNRTAQPVEAELRVEALPVEVTTIRIVSATNELSVPIAQ